MAIAAAFQQTRQAPSAKVFGRTRFSPLSREALDNRHQHAGERESNAEKEGRRRDTGKSTEDIARRWGTYLSSVTEPGRRRQALVETEMHAKHATSYIDTPLLTCCHGLEGRTASSAVPSFKNSLVRDNASGEPKSSGSLH